MKRLYFSRHAKSDWGYPRLDDHDRPLNERGRRDAPIMAVRARANISHIDLCISSTAKRAKSTAKAYRKVFNFNEYIKEPRIYSAYLDDILDLILEIPDKYSSAILFGHNPTFTEVYNHFSKDYLDNLPTCGFFGMTSTASFWQDVDHNNTTIDFLMMPKDNMD